VARRSTAARAEPVATPRKLEGKVALVSGSGRGIGRAIATKLASEGAKVVVNDLDEGPANETIAWIRAAGGEAVLCAGSVTDPGFADRFVGAALDAFGGLDIIVNNAGFTWDGVIQKMTDEQFQAVLDVHVTAPFRILRAATEPIRRFAKQEAEEGREVYRKVVNISSVSGLGGNAGQVNYAAAKAAVIGMTRALAKEWGRYRVNVNCVAFGFIRTRMTQALDASNAPVDVGGRELRYGVQPALIDMLEKQQIPLGRMGTPEEAADGVYLFCTPESNYISGQVITVGGGIRF
jgi:3-oxoacyl-[acyl-carrier protein] reductase